ncbi:MAG: hypothetical protein KKD44_28155 [Proteobacteria bacterium]|nr:hypothetical protein [Pseudomonadota bacterium]
MAEIIARLQGLFSDAQMSLTSAGDYLPMLRGTVNTRGSKGWKRVYYAQPFKTPPQVFVQGSPGISDYKPRKIQFESVNIPNVDIPIIDVKLPDIQLPDVSTFLINQINATAWDNTGNIILDALTNTAKAPIIAVLLIFSHYVGQAFDKFNNEYIEPMLNKIVQILRDIRDKINNDLIGLPANPKIGSINRALDDSREQLEAVINQIGDTMEFAINNTVDYVFEFIGMVDKIPIAPTAVQNVTETSFEFYSNGGDYGWMALGIFQ